MTINVEGVSFAYPSFPALGDVTFTLAPGEITSVIGPNGSGKSTLIKCIDMILRPSGGAITVNGTPLATMSRREIARHIAYVPQSTASTFPLTVFDMILMGRAPHQGLSGTSEGDLSRVGDALHLLRIDHLAMRPLSTLSGGQQQMVLLARALVQETPVLLLDEPTSALDIYHQLEFLETLAERVRSGALSALVSIHDLNLAARFSDRVLLLSRGRIIATGTPEEVITQANLREVYGVEVAVERVNGQPFVVPLRRAPDAGGGQSSNETGDLQPAKP